MIDTPYYFNFISDAFQKTIENYGNIDILINSAGIMDEINWERSLQVNLVGISFKYSIIILFPKM